MAGSICFLFVRMKIKTLRDGTSLLEVILFLGIFSIIATTVTAVFLSTQDARALQRSISLLEDSGTQLIGNTTRTTRRAEAIVSPGSGTTGSTLVLQMAQNDEFPTIIGKIGSGLTLVQQTATSSLLAPAVTVNSAVFRNIGGGNVWFTFTLSTIARTVKPRTYTRVFYGTATLFPDDQSDAGGCGTCPAPACISNAYTWYICASDVCTQSDVTLPC